MFIFMCSTTLLYIWCDIHFLFFFFLHFQLERAKLIYVVLFISVFFPYLFKRQGRTRPDKSPAPRMLNYLKVYIITCKTYNYILWQIKNFHLYLVLISIVLLVCDIVCTEHEHYVILVGRYIKVFNICSK